MPLVAMVTLVLVAVIVLALAFYLTWVVLLLRRIDDTLGKVTFGVRSIAHRTALIGPAVGSVNANLTTVAEALEDLAGRVQPPAKAS